MGNQAGRQGRVQRRQVDGDVMAHRAGGTALPEGKDGTEQRIVSQRDAQHDTGRRLGQMDAIGGK